MRAEPSETGNGEAIQMKVRLVDCMLGAMVACCLVTLTSCESHSSVEEHPVVVTLLELGHVDCLGMRFHVLGDSSVPFRSPYDLQDLAEKIRERNIKTKAVLFRLGRDVPSSELTSVSQEFAKLGFTDQRCERCKETMRELELALSVGDGPCHGVPQHSRIEARRGGIVRAEGLDVRLYPEEDLWRHDETLVTLAKSNMNSRCRQESCLEISYDPNLRVVELCRYLEVLRRMGYYAQELMLSNGRRLMLMDTRCFSQIRPISARNVYSVDDRMAVRRSPQDWERVEDMSSDACELVAGTLASNNVNGCCLEAYGDMAMSAVDKVLRTAAEAGVESVLLRLGGARIGMPQKLMECDLNESGGE